MDRDAYRDFRLLTEIAADDLVTQRSLAKKYGLALGLTNFLIRRLARKGYIKLSTRHQKRLRYLITPRGLAAKTRLTLQYLDYSLGLYRSIRTFLARALSIIVEAGGQGTVLIGTGEVAEIVFLILQQHGVHIVAVLGESPTPAVRFMSQPVEGLERLPSFAYDWVVVASFKERRRILQRLAQWGVPEQKVITIPDEERRVTVTQPMAEVIPDAAEPVAEARFL